MTWQEEFIKWCKTQRDLGLERAEWLESGKMRMHVNNEDVSADTAARERRNAEELDRLITKVEEDMRDAQGS